MNHNEILQTFFSRTYENELHQQMLAHDDFAFPVETIKDYMVSLTQISLAEVFNYIDNHPDIAPVNTSELCQFSSLTACTDELCDLLSHIARNGATIMDIGSAEIFQKYIRAHHKGSWSRFGNNQAKTAHQLGLTFKNDHRWYLTCYGFAYVYPFLTPRQQKRFLTRALLRNPFYAKVLTNLRLEAIHIKDYVSGLSASTLGARSASIAKLLQLCLEEMNAENIKWHDLYIPRYNARRKELTEYNFPGTASAMDQYALADDYIVNGVPLYSVKAACGYFVDHENPEQEGWMDLSNAGVTSHCEDYFVVHAKGDSMLPKIKDGDLCLFKWYKGEVLYDNIVLTQCREYDAEYESSYTIKRFHRNEIKVGEPRTFSLQPLNKAQYHPILLSEDDGLDYKTIGIFVKVL